MSNIIYVANGKNNGMQIPIRVQVLYGREYCKENNLQFELSKDEKFHDSKFALFSEIIKSKVENIIIFSDILISNKYVEAYLKELIQGEDLEKLSNLKFHITFSNEVLIPQLLLSRIENFRRNRKFSMSIDQLLSYLKSN